MFGGMPAVMSTDLPQIAYAGQPCSHNWNGPNSPTRYNENNNYIFLNHYPRDQLHQQLHWNGAPSVSSFDPQLRGPRP